MGDFCPAPADCELIEHDRALRLSLILPPYTDPMLAAMQVLRMGLGARNAVLDVWPQVRCAPGQRPVKRTLHARKHDALPAFKHTGSTAREGCKPTHLHHQAANQQVSEKSVTCALLLRSNVYHFLVDGLGAIFVTLSELGLLPEASMRQATRCTHKDLSHRGQRRRAEVPESGPQAQ